MRVQGSVRHFAVPLSHSPVLLSSDLKHNKTVITSTRACLLILVSVKKMIFKVNVKKKVIRSHNTESQVVRSRHLAFRVNVKTT